GSSVCNVELRQQQTRSAQFKMLSQEFKMLSPKVQSLRRKFNVRFQRSWMLSAEINAFRSSFNVQLASALILDNGHFWSRRVDSKHADLSRTSEKGGEVILLCPPHFP